ncbi:TPA: hypothetical protein L5U90_003463 [Pseudomonas aeruginosa]|nr:hypothetical protein [Pseudomonas aeruginosa]
MIGIHDETHARLHNSAGNSPSLGGFAVALIAAIMAAVTGSKIEDLSDRLIEDAVFLPIRSKLMPSGGCRDYQLSIKTG